ncbi:protein of unknown function [Candidatus Methylocalor cossyra]|uniref:Tetratricopeptide repeat protein n=2 Tax=Candidatus Methylocalor cossyra TaxID=3108543 RepID=A0ABM9NFA8_9GAMM
MCVKREKSSESCLLNEPDDVKGSGRAYGIGLMLPRAGKEGAGFRLTVLGFLLGVLVGWLPAFKAGAFATTEEDFAKLPPFCKARASGPESATYKLWEQRLGPNFLHVHHYCSGLDWVNKAHSTLDRRKSREWLETALGGFQYMEDQCSSPETFVLMPEILTNKARVLVELGRMPEAAQYFEKALRMNPRYVPAYRSLSDLYLRAKQKEAARQLLDYGIKVNPGNKTLEQLLRRVNQGQ